MSRRGMHVLLVTTGYPPEHSGSGGRIHQLYTRLAAKHPELCWSVVTKRHDLLRSAISVLGPTSVTALTASARHSRVARIWEAAREILWTRRQVAQGLLEDVDLVHCGGWTWFTFEISRLACMQGIPVLRELTSVGDAALSGGPGAWLIRYTNRLADELVAISPGLEAGVRHSGVRTPIWCRPNGVDLSRFHLPSDAERALGRRTLRQWIPNMPDDATVVLHIGRIRPLKNQLFLADCVARLPKHFHLFMAGPAYESSDPYLAEIRQRLAASDLSGRAALAIGQHDTVERFMYGADMFALPSEKEGLGTAMIEALACGLPVVAHEIVGVTDWIIETGVNGRLSALEETRFAEALLENEPLCRRRSEIAAAAACRFDSTAVDEEYWRRITRLARRRVVPCGPASAASP